MTNQEIFDTVARHLLTQKAQSLVDEDGPECAYRGEGGLKCAIGVLIPDAHYTPTIEGRAVASAEMESVLKDILGTSYDVGLLIALQNVHDGCAPAGWKDDLEEVAVSSDLSVAVLNEFP